MLALSGQQSLRTSQLGNSRELAGFTRKRVETGEASLVDASLVELEAQQLQAELLQLAVERTALLGELRPLLGVNADRNPVITGSLPEIGTLPPRGARVGARPDFVAAQSAAEAGQAQQITRAQSGRLWRRRECHENAAEERPKARARTF